MITSSSASLITPPTQNDNQTSNAPQSDSSDSFADVLHQQDDRSSNTSQSRQDASSNTNQTSTPTTQASPKTPDQKTPASDSNDDTTQNGTTNTGTTAAPVKTKSSAATTTKNSPASLPPGSALSAMLIQATVLASSAKTGPATPDATNGAPGKDSAQTATNSPDLAALIAQVFAAAQKTTTPTPTAKTSTGTANDSDAKDTSDKTPSTATTIASDLSTLIAQASILASTTPQTPTATTTTTTPGNGLPLSVLAKAVTTITGKEKKSASANSEGSFLQSDTGSSTATFSASTTPGSLLSLLGELTGAQQVTAANGSNNSTANDLSKDAAPLGGIANVEKGKVMNTDLNFPGIDALSGFGANSAGASSNQTAPDMHILLGSNHDFTDALKQVMHVASLTDTAEARTPMRVAIEIQTPPGAVVNVYVSKQNDEYRAQLSTNDPAALSWVQDQMSSLKSSDMGVTVKWLPPQMESGPSSLATANSSNGQESNLGWDRGGQGQNQQQPDERSQSERQKRAGIVPELAAVGSNPFMNTFNALGRAA